MRPLIYWPMWQVLLFCLLVTLGVLALSFGLAFVTYWLFGP